MSLKNYLKFATELTTQIKPFKLKPSYIYIYISYNAETTVDLGNSQAYNSKNFLILESSPSECE